MFFVPDFSHFGKIRSEFHNATRRNLRLRAPAVATTGLTDATARYAIQTPKRQTAFSASAKHSKHEKLLTPISQNHALWKAKGTKTVVRWV